MTKYDLKADVVAEVMDLLRLGKISSSTANSDVIKKLSSDADDNDEVFVFYKEQVKVLHNCLHSDSAYMMYDGYDIFDDLLYKL